MDQLKIRPVLPAYLVAEMLGLHTNSVKRISPKELPFFRVGSRGDRRYYLDDVQAYITKRRVS
jgi:hypothetical protein